MSFCIIDQPTIKIIAVGMAMAAIFLMRSSRKLTAEPKDLEDFAIKIAVEHLNIPEIATWLKKQTA